MATPRAADLPEGTIVEYAGVRVQRYSHRWAGIRTGNTFALADIDHALDNGGELLRYGYGDNDSNDKEN